MSPQGVGAGNVVCLVGHMVAAAELPANPTSLEYIWESKFVGQLLTGAVLTEVL